MKKHTIILTAALLCLTACKDKKEQPAAATPEAPKEQTVTGLQPSDIAINQNIASANDWSKSFQNYYNPIMACVKADTNKVRKIINVIPADNNMLLIVLEEETGATQECLFDQTKPLDPPRLQAGQAPPPTGTHFYPEGNALPPPDSCLNNMAVKSVSGERLGWLSYQLCAAGQQ